MSERVNFCHNCAYWKRISIPDVFGRSKEFGECRQDAPGFDWNEKDSLGRHIGVWPSTGEAAWCGKHSAKVEE